MLKPSCPKSPSNFAVCQCGALEPEADDELMTVGARAVATRQAASRRTNEENITSMCRKHEHVAEREKTPLNSAAPSQSGFTDGRVVRRGAWPKALLFVLLASTHPGAGYLRNL